MELLKNKSGYTLIETVVSIGLLGVLIVLSAFVYTRFFNNPKILLRDEALLLANMEITNSVNRGLITDTSYMNANGNLKVERKIEDMGSYNKISVIIIFVQNGKVIINLSADIKKSFSPL